MPAVPGPRKGAPWEPGAWSCSLPWQAAQEEAESAEASVLMCLQCGYSGCIPC